MKNLNCFVLITLAACGGTSASCPEPSAPPPAEAPKADVPHVEAAPQPEASKVEAPKADAPKSEAPAADKRKLTKAQLEDAKKTVRDGAKATYKETFGKLESSLGKPMKQEGETQFWFGKDDKGACFEFFVMNMNDHASGAMISPAMKPGDCE